MSGGKHWFSGARLHARRLYGGSLHKEHSFVKHPPHAVGHCKTVSPELLCSSKLELLGEHVLTDANTTKQIREEQEIVFLQAFPTLQFSSFLFLFFFFSLVPLLPLHLSSIFQSLSPFPCFLNAEPCTFDQAPLQVPV